MIKQKIGGLIARFFPVLYIEIQWKRRFGKRINWDAPADLNEKIQWLKRFTDTSSWSLLSDKYRVREYVSEKGFKENLVGLLGKWDSVETIEWERLPRKFVLKLNNGSGDVIVCYDKNELDIPNVKKELNKHLKSKFGNSTAEQHYLRIKPCVIAEELLDKCKQSVTSTSLIDYKIWCFNGKPECVWVYLNRSKSYVEIAVYDLEWKRHDEYLKYTDHFQKARVDIPRPKSLEKMLVMASKLSAGFPQLRVDLYEVADKPFFGELTFTSSSGMMDHFTDEYLQYLGSKVILPLNK